VILYPAIDLLGGRVVRLRQGDYGESTTYDDDPVSVAIRFVEAGAEWIHVVDLDAARTGKATNRSIIADVCRAVTGRAHVQTGGGVRTVDDAMQLRSAGVARVVMGSAAVAHPDVVAEVASVVPVAVGLDHREGAVAVHGWTESSGVSLHDVLGAFPEADALIITDISRDGMLAGPDLEGLRSASGATATAVIASGGVGSIDHLRLLATVEGLAGVIVGRALYEGTFDVRDALVALGHEPDRHNNGRGMNR
jgi:phosphoribosylformimino-5-aminoimidazole carboxamide ribotide isomerase